jgi:hypothetical protein
MDNVQNCDIYSNISTSQTYRPDFSVAEKLHLIHVDRNDKSRFSSRSQSIGRHTACASAMIVKTR